MNNGPSSVYFFPDVDNNGQKIYRPYLSKYKKSFLVKLFHKKTLGELEIRINEKYWREEELSSNPIAPRFAFIIPDELSKYKLSLFIDSKLNDPRNEIGIFATLPNKKEAASFKLKWS